MREYDMSNRHILVIDDSRTFLTLMTDLLRSFGARNVIRTTDAIEAFEIIGREKIDLALVDYNMPLINGFEFASMVRCAPDSANKFMPMILVTGHSSRRLVMDCITHGFDDFLAKPLSAKNLFEKMVRVFENPEPYILTPSGYFGPDRRRRDDPNQTPDTRRELDLAIPVGPRDIRLIQRVQGMAQTGNNTALKEFWAGIIEARKAKLADPTDAPDGAKLEQASSAA